MKNNIPAIRFPEFTLGWKSTTLNKVTNIIGGGTPDTKEPTYWDGEIDWYSPSEIGKKIYADGSVRKITQLGLEKSSAKILPANKTILFTSRAGIGDTAILKKDGATNQGFQSLVVHDNCDVYFLYSMNNKIKSYALKNASGSTFLEISGKNLGVMPMLIPSPEEQTKIGTFFKSLDDTISLHQQELEVLKKTKQGFLQKMFPKDGESIPEIRFSNEIGCWEEAKLGKVAPLRGGYAFKSNLFCEKGTPIVRISNINSNGKIDGEFVYIPEDPTYETYLLRNNSTLIAMSGATTGKVATIRNLSSKIYQNQRVGYFRKTNLIDYEFLSTLLKSNFFKAKLKELLVAGAQPNISSKDIDNLEFFIPTKLEEQVKIGEFFRQLDEVIELKEKEIEALKETKKGFLQKMFV